MSKCEVVRGHGGSSLKGGVSRTGWGGDLWKDR